MALQLKPKFQVCKKLKREIGFEEYLQYAKGAGSRLFLKVCLGTSGLFEELGRHDNVGGSQECPNCGTCKESVEHVLIECASYDSQRLDFLDSLKTVLPPNAFDTFFVVAFLIKLHFVWEIRKVCC